LQLSDHALAMANVETIPVARRELAHELRTVGKVQYNESSLATVTARVDGYAERLFVNFTGVQIQAGDHLAEIYSPALEVAQGDLLMALRDGMGPMAEATRAKLKRWGLTDAQVADLVEHRKLTDRVTLTSPIAGTVIEKSIVENSAFKAGDPLYRIANLDTVWVYLDVYEYDLPWVRFGQQVELTAEALPGWTIQGRVTFVQPIVNEETRTIRVPVHVENKGHALKPGMFVSAVIRARLGADGTAAPTGLEGKFSCVMHPQVVRDEPGDCPVCGMKLERVPGDRTSAGPPEGPLPLAVPAAAVLDSGTRRIAYVEKSKGLFEAREIVLGPRSGAWFPVLQGLAEGERVVSRGGFLIDSQFQIAGHPSLFYPGGVVAGTAGHHHGGAGSDNAGGAPPTQAGPPPTAPGGPHRH
jgi:Cu(I)/Ag(I) efflux system membrane fusion protein